MSEFTSLKDMLGNRALVEQYRKMNQDLMEVVEEDEQNDDVPAS